MGDGNRRSKSFTVSAHKKMVEEAKRSGHSEERVAQQEKKVGLDPLIDPAGSGVVRLSQVYKDKVGATYVAVRDVPMLVMHTYDTTGSMGHNNQLILEHLPRTYSLLKDGPRAPLANYELDMIHAPFGDECDKFALRRSCAEFGLKIGEVILKMRGEGDGGDFTEDPQVALFGDAYLVDAIIHKYGHKAYHFTTTDADGRKFLDKNLLKRVFGPNVFDYTAKNGFPIDEFKLPTTHEVVQDLLKKNHAFVFFVPETSHSEERKNRSLLARNYWTDMYGKDRVIDVHSTEFLPEYQAVVIGLTEGTLSLRELDSYLKEECHLDGNDISYIKRAVAGIPINLQTQSPNFGKLPRAGAVFAAAEDLWPIAEDALSVVGNEDDDDLEGGPWVK